MSKKIKTIYTIGHKESYLRGIRESPNGVLQKMGRRLPSGSFPDGYIGGYAFLTAKDAQRRIDEEYPEREFAIFGLKADWRTGAEPGINQYWRNLLYDSDIGVLIKVIRYNE